jgi:hypothetical protein
MAKFAVIINNIVDNVILADTKEVAEEVTGHTCVEYTEENPAIIGLGYANGVFEQREVPTE